MIIFKTKKQKENYFRGLKIINDYMEKTIDPDTVVSLECDDELKTSFYIKIILDTVYFDDMSKKDKKELKSLGFRFSDDKYCDKVTFDVQGKY